MKDIIVKHSSIKITDYTLGECPKLESIFSVFNRINFTSYPCGIYYDEETKDLYIPRGVDVKYIERLFDKEAIIDKSYQKFDMIDPPIMIKYLPRDNVQKTSLRFMLGMGEYSNMQFRSQQALNLAGGKGKSYVSIATISYLNIKSAIITYSINWLNQWKDYFLEYTDIKAKEIKFINSSSTIRKIINDPSYTDKYKIFLMSHSTIKSYAEANGWKEITKLFEALRIGLKFYDEAHLNFENMYMIDFYTNVYKTFYVTGTLNRSSEDEDRIFNLYFKNVPAIELFDEEEDPHTEYLAIKYNSRPTPQQISSCRNAYGLDRNKYASYVVNQDNFKKIMRITLELFTFKLSGKTLIYIGTNEGIIDFKQWLEEEYPELIGNVGIYTSLTNGPTKKDELEKKIILSTTKSTGLAMDIKDLRVTINAAEPFKSQVLAKQTLWRTRADNTFFIELIDMGFNQCKKYYYSKKEVYEKYALSNSESSFSENELSIRSDKIIDKRIEYMNTYNILDSIYYGEPIIKDAITINNVSKDAITIISAYPEYKGIHMID